MSGAVSSSLALFYALGTISVLAVSVTVLVLARRGAVRVHPHTVRNILGAVLVCSLYIPIAQYLKHRSLHFFVDISHWLQLLHSIVETGRPESLNSELVIPGTLNYLSSHFVPYIYLIALPFSVIPHAETLFVINYVVMVSAVIPLYKLARACGLAREVGWCLAILLLAYPTFQYIVLYEFEMLRFSIPALLWMLYFWETRRMTAYWLVLALAVLVREDVSLTIAMFGVYVALFEKRKREGLLTAVAGMSAFWLISQVLMPALSTRPAYEHVAAGVFSQFGKTPGEAIRGIVTQPMLAISMVAHPVKLANLFMMGLPLLFLPLFAPFVLVSTLANLGVGLLSSSLVHTSYMLYYLSPTVPFLFYAIVKAWPRFGHAEAAVMAAALAGMLTANVFFGPSPISLQFWLRDVRPAPFRSQSFHRSVYRVTDHHRRAEDMARLIPEDSVVSTQQFLHPAVFRARGAMVFPQLKSADGTIDADYVLLDATNNGISPESPAYVTPEQFDLVTTHPERWRLVTAAGDYSLFKRDDGQANR